MGLRDQAELDLATTLEDPDGWGWAINVTAPDGDTVDLYGQSNDIEQLIDPDTGTAVGGRLASCAMRISTLAAAGIAMPEGIQESAGKPYVIVFDDIGGTAWTFKVNESRPDRGMGVVVCILEQYNP